MAITGRTATVAELASATSITGTIPADYVSGDLVVAVFAMTCTAAQFTGPGGSWVQLCAPTEDGGGDVIAAYYQFSPASGPTGASSGASGRCSVIVQAYGGVDTTTPVDAAAVTSTGSGSSLAATGVTTATAGTRLISGFALNTSSRTITIPSGMTEVESYSASSTGRALAVADEVRATAGATGTRTWAYTPTSTLNMVAFCAALRSASKSFTATRATAVAASGALATGMSGSRATAVSSAGGLQIGAGLTGSRATTIAASGATLSTVSRIFSGTLEIEFTTGVWTDVSDRVSFRSGPIRVVEGKASEGDEIGPGVLTVVLSNYDGAFMPDNSGSPYYPHVIEDLRIRWRVSKSGTTYTRFVGWIQSWTPTFPSGDLSSCTTTVVATDALGRLAQRRLRSNFTETVLWRAWLDGCFADVWEAVGGSASQLGSLSNYSRDSSPGGSTAIAAGTDTAVQFSSQADGSFGGSMSITTTQSGKVSCTVQAGATPLQILIHYRPPADLVPTVGVFYPLATFRNTAGTVLGHLCLTINGASNGVYLRNAANTANIGGILMNAPFDNWFRFTLTSNLATPSTVDLGYTLFDGGTLTMSGLALDIRSVGSIQIPGNSTPSAPGAWGGIAVLGTRTTIGWWESVVGADGGSIGERANSISNTTYGALPWGFAGTSTVRAATGQWSGRTALEVWQELARTMSGIVWGRPRDAVIAVVAPDQLWPASPVATIDVDRDCEGPPRLGVGTEHRPTRVDVEWPGGIATAIDASAEAAGTVRSRRISTVATTAAQALAVGQDVLDHVAYGRLRITGVTVDLTFGETDHSAVLLSQSTPLGGLFPGQRIRLTVPVSHFGAGTKDFFVLGWEESWGSDRALLTLYLAPAP